ncbi:hypothetical protein AA0111_g2264 [Alternaria arborescens]|uniref:hypothetical protein n=1 Tax=Alternaria arborescens TaxID=156630 RepID=UPI001074E906|nr:hypothetical protein AA0111_g2264 [Alternaria arborescens]RYO37571.1 hypothetical protein AA0111_g2264 [Alternaria arborescens]
MSPITDLPTELLEYIVLDLESCDAVNLAQTCKTLHTVALPAAYNTITLLWDNTSEDDEDGGTVDGRKGPKIQALVRTLKKKPQYIDWVKNLEFYAENCLEYNFEDVLGYDFPRIDYDMKDEEWMDEMFSVYADPKDTSVQWPELDDEHARHMLVALLIGICQARLESLTIAWEFFPFNQWFPTMMKHGIGKNATEDDGPKWFANLKTVRVELEESDMAETWGQNFLEPQGTLLLFFYLPVVESLQIVACSKRDDYGNVSSGEEGVDLSFEWPLALPPVPHTLTTLRLVRSSMDPLTIHHLLRQATNLRVFEYDCYAHPHFAPLQLSILKDALRHIHSTLTDLIVRYQHYNSRLAYNPAHETENAVGGSLGPLHDFPVLTNLTISFPVLFGTEAVALDSTASLTEFLPATLETLTITDDLWEYQDLQGRFEDVHAMAFFRQYLAGERPSRSLKRLEPYTIVTTRGKVDLDKVENGVLWVQDREPEWKVATPRLKKLTYDLTTLCCGYWHLSKPREQLLGLCESQGIEGEVLLWSLNSYHNLQIYGWR